MLPGCDGQTAPPRRAPRRSSPGRTSSSTPADAKGLLKAAIRDDNPIIFLEAELLYGVKGEVPTGEHVLPPGECGERTDPGRGIRRGRELVRLHLEALDVRGIDRADDDRDREAGHRHPERPPGVAGDRAAGVRALMRSGITIGAAELRDLLAGIEDAVRAAQPAPRVVIVSLPQNPTTAIACRKVSACRLSLCTVAGSSTRSANLSRCAPSIAAVPCAGNAASAIFQS